MNWQQKALLRAIQRQSLPDIRSILDNHSNILRPIGTPFTTPLHEAIKVGNLDIIKLLVARGADVNFPDRGGSTPLDMALRRHRDDITLYLKSRNAVIAAKKPAPVPQVAAPLEDKPYFSAKNLPDVFNPEKWVGQVKEMAKLWDKVPWRLKDTFDFSSAYSNARQRTLKQNHPKKDVFKKPPSL
jgi:ankyrin repeat protein